MRHYHNILIDALNHAIGVATRAQEATEGTNATLLFNEVRAALQEFKSDSPCMNALTKERLELFEKERPTRRRKP